MYGSKELNFSAWDKQRQIGSTAGRTTLTGLRPLHCALSRRRSAVKAVRRRCVRQIRDALMTVTPLFRVAKSSGP